MRSRIVFLGPPASGKGSQVELIQKRFKIPATSTGAILRYEAKIGTQLGLEAQLIVKHGGLAPDDLVMNLVEIWLKEIDGPFLFDGFPRTIRQAERLEDLLAQRGTPLSLAVFLDVAEETILTRMRSRLNCAICTKVISVGRHVQRRDEACPNCGGELEARADDTEEAFTFRLAAYWEKSFPVVNYYETRGLLAHVHGDRDAEEVFKEIALLIAG